MVDDQKHKRIVTEPLSPKDVSATLDTLRSVISQLSNKQQHLLKEWLDDWSNYLVFERRFKPQKLIYYKRGDIVFAQFGYNVGNELGGKHFAIVVENNNNKTTGIVMVVPLSSLEQGKTKDDLHKTEIFIGKIINDKDSYAMPLQMRPISKLRIIKPKKNEHEIKTVSDEILDQIDEKIRQSFTKP